MAVRGPGPGNATTPPAGWESVDAKHKDPTLVAQGWDFGPGAHALAPLVDLIDRKIINLSGPVGAAMADALRPALLAESTRAFATWSDALTKARGDTRVVGALSSVVVSKLAARGMEPASAALSVRDEDVLHTHRKGKADALPWAWYRELPRHVAAPRAVLLDKTDPKGALLMVFDVAGRTAKLVVKIDYAIAVREGALKKKRLANILRSGKFVPPESLGDKAAYEVLEGEL